MSETLCRFCRASVEAVFADLGMSPLANSYLPPERGNSMEPFYPLRALVCGKCFLVQLEEFETPERIFSDYAYFSSYSSSWLEHSRHYSELMIERLGLGEDSHVVEIASNDGYLLQFFHERQIPVLGIEPAANVAKAALQKGIPTLVEFFGQETAALAGRRIRRRPAAGKQRARACPRPQRLRRGDEDPAEGGGCDHDGVPPSDEPGR